MKNSYIRSNDRNICLFVGMLTCDKNRYTCIVCCKGMLDTMLCSYQTAFINRRDLYLSHLQHLSEERSANMQELLSVWAVKHRCLPFLAQRNIISFIVQNRGPNFLFLLSLLHISNLLSKKRMSKNMTVICWKIRLMVAFIQLPFTD